MPTKEKANNDTKKQNKAVELLNMITGDLARKIGTLDIKVCKDMKEYYAQIEKTMKEEHIKYNLFYSCTTMDPQFKCEAEMLRWPHMDVEWRMLNNGRIKTTGAKASAVAIFMGGTPVARNRTD